MAVVDAEIQNRRPSIGSGLQAAKAQELALGLSSSFAEPLSIEDVGVPFSWWIQRQSCAPLRNPFVYDRYYSR